MAANETIAKYPKPVLQKAQELCDIIRNKRGLDFKKELQQAFPNLNEEQAEELYAYGMYVTR